VVDPRTRSLGARTRVARYRPSSANETVRPAAGFGRAGAAPPAGTNGNVPRHRLDRPLEPTTQHALATFADPVPLIVDLDGTLIDGDTLHLSLALLVRRQPWAIPVLPLLVLSGRAQFKRFVSDRVSLDASSLPYRADVLEFIRRERAGARRIVLATAADRPIADAVATHLALFDDVIASDGSHNAKGLGKLESIRAHLGDGEFDYVGDSMADLPVFRAARRAYLVCPGRALTEAAQTGCRVEAIFAPRG
jgi:phosphoserine phosphatase